MKKSNPPQTSIDAWRSITHEQISAHHAIILDALKKLTSGSAEQIAIITGLSHIQVNRRMSELNRLNIVYRTGDRASTTTGRSASIWKISEATLSIEIPAKQMRKRIPMPAFSGKKFAQSSLF